MRFANVNDCVLLDVPTIRDSRGNLGFINEVEHVPFQIRRAYFLWDIPDGVSRGGHAHKELQQFLIVLRGQLEVLIKDGVTEKLVRLNQPTHGLLITSMIWRELNFTAEETVVLVLASELYDPNDYIREFDEYLQIAQTL